MTLDSAVCMRSWGGALVFVSFIYLARVDSISFGRGSFPKPFFHLGKAGLWRSSIGVRRYVFPDSRWLSTLFTFPDSVQLRFTCSCLRWAMLIKPVLY